MNVDLSGKDTFTYARNLTDLIEAAARRFPDKTIIHVDPESGAESSSTYLALSKVARNVAAELQKRGYRPGDVIIFVIDSTRLFVPMFWGCVLAGVVPAPLAAPVSTNLDTMEADKIRNVAADLSVPVLFDSRNAKLAESMRGILGSNASRLIFADEILLAAQLSPSEPDLPEVDGDEMAILQFSSGSSGHPKGVMLSHRNLLSNTRAQVRLFQVDASDTLVTWMPYFHDFGLFWGHIAAMGAGLKQVRIDHNHFARRPALWLDKVHEHRATFSNTTPTALDHLLGYLEMRRSKSKDNWDLSSLRGIVVGAEMIQPRSCRKFVEMLRSSGIHDNIFVNGYGLTETTMGTTGTHPNTPLKTVTLDRLALVRKGEVKRVSADAENAAEFATVGHTVEEYGLRIVDQNGAVLEPDRIGTIEIAGDHVTSGYYKNPTATADSLKLGWLDTGDLGFLDEAGDLFITGRRKEVIIVNGHNHYPYDLEQMVWRSTPEARDAFRFVGVSGFYNPKSSKDEIGLFIVPMRGDETRRRELLRRVCAKVNDLAGFPINHVVLIAGKDVARTSSGKVMRRVLHERFLNGDFDQGIVHFGAPAGEEPVAAAPRDRGSIEAVVRRIWGETLELGNESLKANANFFELGGNSIKAGLMQMRLEEALNFRLEPNFTYLCPGLDKQIDNLAGRDFSIEPAENEIEQIVLAVIQDELPPDAKVVSVTQRIAAIMPGMKAQLALLAELNRVFDLEQADVAALAGDTPRDIARAVSERLELGANKKEQPFPLMNFQETLYFHRKGFVRNEPSRLSCFIFLELMLTGRIDPRKLEAAFDLIIARHPVLRAIIDDSTDQPRMKILESVSKFQVTHHDISDLPEAEQRRILTARGRDMNDIRFEIERWPLFICDLYSLGAERSAFLFNIDHFLVDGYSFMHLLEDLFRAYDELNGVDGALSARESASLSFRDYILIEKARQRTKSYQRAMEFQLGIFSDLPPKATLPFQHDPAAIDPVLFETNYRMLDPKMIGNLIDLAGRHAVSINSLLLAAYFKLVNIWSNQDDLIINMPVFNREQYFAGARRVMGSFIDIFPVRIKTRCDEPVTAIAERVEAFARELLSNPVSSIELSRHIANRDGAQSGSMSSLIFSNSFGVYTNETDGIQCVDINKPHFRTGAPGTFIDLVLYDFKGEYYLNWNYVRGLLSDEFMATLADQYERILTSLADEFATKAPAADTFDIGLLMLEKHKALISDLNDSAAPTPVSTLHAIIEETIASSPDAVALTFNEMSLTYKELNEAANRLANLLTEIDADKSRFIALLFDRGPEMIIAQLAVMKARCAYVPLDPDYPQDRISYMIDDCEAAVLLCQQRHLHHVESGDIGALKNVVVLYSSEDIKLPKLTAFSQNDITRQRPEFSKSVSPDDLAYMIYTSGSTGAPKGVMVKHRNIINFLHWVRTEFSISPEDRFAFVTSYSFDMTLASNWVPFMAGAVLHILDEEHTRDVEHLLRFISDKKITFLNVTPSHFSLIASARAYLSTPTDGLPMNPGMRVMLGGEIINTKDLNLWLDFYPTHRFINEYGPTEASVASSFFPIPVGPAGRIEMKVVPIGKTLANNAFYILDGEGNFCLPGVAGELCIGGDGVAAGYYRKPDKTEAAFVDDPFRPGQKMYRTGDMARLWDDGNVEFLGRRDHQINLRGYRIEGGEIESALTAHPAVVQTAVVLRNDTAGHAQLVAFYTSADGAEIQTAELRAHLSQRLPKHMIPAHFQWLASMPRTPSGKFDSKSLPAVVIAPSARADAVPPRTDLERTLHAIWSDILETSTFGVTDNFWDLGGDSLKAMRLILRCREKGLSSIGLREVFAHQTIQDAAAFLSKSEDASTKAISLTRIVSRECPIARLVLVPYACGSSSAFFDLARHLSNDIDILSIEPFAPGATSIPSIKTLGAAFADEIASMDDVPLILGGYSYGGYVAFEAARQLQLRNHPVSGIIMIASTPPGARRELDWVVSATQEEILDYSRSIYGFSGKQFTRDELESYVRILKLQSQSMIEYDFDPALEKLGPALVLVGEKEEDHQVREGMDAWRQYLDVVSIDQLPGGHMLIKTNVKELSARMRRFIRDTLASKS